MRARAARGRGPRRRRFRCDCPCAADGPHPRGGRPDRRPSCCPAAAPVAAADPNVLRIGTTQDLDSLNPYGTALRRRLRGFRPQLRPAGRVRPEQRAGPGLRRIVGARRRRHCVDVQDPRGDDLVRRPAGHGRGRPLHAPDHTWTRSPPRTRASATATSTRRHRTPAITKVECPDATTMIVTTSRTHRPDPAELRPDPAASTSGGRSRIAQDRRGSVQQAPQSSAPGRTRSSSGRPASSSGSTATRTTGATQGAADEIDHPVLRQPRTRWSRPQDRRDRLRPRRSRPTSSTRSKTRREHRRPSTARPTAGPSSASTPTARHRQHDPGRRRRPRRRSATRRSATRSATPSTSDAARRPRPQRLRRRSGTTHRAGLTRNGTSEPTNVRARSTWPWRTRSSTEAGYASSTRRRPARQGRQADQPAAGHARTSDDTYPKDAQFIADWFGQIGIKVDAAVGRRRARSSTEYLATGDPLDGPAPTTTCSSGAGSATRTRTSLLQIFDCDAIGGSTDSLWCNRATTSCTTSRTRRQTAEERKAADRPRCSSCSTTRRRITSCTTTTSCTPTARTSSRTGRTSRRTGTPFFVYGTIDYTLLQRPSAHRRRRRPRRRRRAGARGGRTPAPRRRASAAAARPATTTPTPARGRPGARRGSWRSGSSCARRAGRPRTKTSIAGRPTASSDD